MSAEFLWPKKKNCVKTVIYIIYVNIQCVFDHQETNAEHFNELKT